MIRSFLFAFLFSVVLRAQNPAVTVTIDAQANRRPINPQIYGVNLAGAATLRDLNAPLNRYGGNNTTRYNWKLNADNRANDFYFESIAEANATAGERGDTFISGSRSGGAEPMLTIPMIGWVASLGPNRGKLASFSIGKYGAQTGNDASWFPDAGNGVRTNGSFVTGNDPKDANVPNDSQFQADWVQHILGRFGPARSGGLRYYILDNEHSIWHSTHRDVSPTGAHAAEIRDKVLEFAGRIHALDPQAQVVGPEEWGWSGYILSGFDQQAGQANGYSYYPDRQTVMGGLDYLPWLLAQWKGTGAKPIDVFSVHYYPQGGEFSNDTSTNMQLLRNRSTRSLWDPAYTDPTWIATQVRLIPRLKEWVNTYYYSGTPVGVTEYNWGAEGHINGATTQADILGIFGREGLDMATRWTTPDATTPTYKAMKLYRNYDGTQGAFGDTSVKAAAPNPDNLSAFAAVRTSDQALTVMVVNKVLSGSTPVTVSLGGFSASGPAAVYQLTSANAINRLADVPAAGTSVALTVPAQSVTLLVIPGRAGVPPANRPPIAVFTATPSTGQAPLAVAFNGSASSDPDGSIAGYSWSFGDGASGTGATASHLYAAAGVYTATLSVTDNAGATNAATKTITVTAAPVNKPPVAVINATPVTGTAPLAVSFSGTGSSDPDGTIASYTWSFGDGTAGTGVNVSHTYAAAGSYTATLTVKDNQGAAGTATKSIAVNAAPGGGAACLVRYTVANDWGNGFLADLSFMNQGKTALNGWTLTWTFAGTQSITNLWNGTVVQSGKSVSVANVGYNGQVAPGGSVGLGFVANYGGTNAKPGNFAVNGKVCTVQ